MGEADRDDQGDGTKDLEETTKPTQQQIPENVDGNAVKELRQVRESRYAMRKRVKELQKQLDKMKERLDAEDRSGQSTSRDQAPRTGRRDVPTGARAPIGGHGSTSTSGGALKDLC